MIKHSSGFRIMMALKRRKPNIIALSKDDDYGLYISGFQNSFGTTLAARGTWQEINNLLEEN